MTCILGIDMRSKKLPDDERIVVFEDGHVFKRINVTHPERSQWHEYAIQTDKNGYRYLRLAGKKWLIHRLVYALFVGELIDGLVVCHRDGEPSNNASTNLLQATQAVNITHKREHGTWQNGEQHGRALYSQSTVNAVISRWNKLPRSRTGRVRRGSALMLAAEMGVSIHLVYDLTKGAWQR